MFDTLTLGSTLTSFSLWDDQIREMQDRWRTITRGAANGWISRTRVPRARGSLRQKNSRLGHSQQGCRSAVG